MFPADWFIESQGFNIVHKTVLGLNPKIKKLDDLLASVPESIIDSGDDYGRTPLWWAAYRGDYSAIRSLLRYNVDICRLSNAGWSILSTAMRYKNQRCVRLLLQHSPGPDLSQYESRGWLVFHRAAYYGMNVDILKATIPPGVNINVVTSDNIRCTALMYAAQNDYHHICEHLLSLGADPNISNTLGETALHYALQYNSQKAIQLLIRHVNNAHKTQAGETFLHCAAQHSDTNSLKVLYIFGLRGICTKNTVAGSSPTQIYTKVVGLTALNIAEQRTDVSSEWLAMFRKLLHKTEFPDDPVHADGMHEEEEEIFHDAVDSQGQ